DDLDAPLLLVAEDLVAAWRLLQWQAVGNDEAGIDLAALNPLQQRPQVALHMGLAHPEGQALAERRSERELVHEPAVHPRDGDAPALAAGLDRLLERVQAVEAEPQRLLGRGRSRRPAWSRAPPAPLRRCRRLGRGHRSSP